MWRRWWMAACVCVLVVACGESGPEAETASRVTAPDGSAALLVPDGAMPDGADPGSLTLDPIPASEVFDGDPAELAAAYRLEPDGTVFSEPATLEVPISLDPGAVVQAVGISETPELLDGLELEGFDEEASGPQQVTLHIPVHHFSDIAVLVWVPPEGNLIVEPDPVGSQAVGAPFEPTATATLGDSVAKVEERRFHHGDRSFVQVVDVRVGTETWRSRFMDFDMTGPVGPYYVSTYLEGYDGPARHSYPVLTTEPLECEEPGSFVLNWRIIGSVGFELTITQTWEDTGEEFYRLSDRYPMGSHPRGMAGSPPVAIGEATITGDCVSGDVTTTTTGTAGGPAASIEGAVTVAGTDPSDDFTPAETLAERGFEEVEAGSQPGLDITGVEVVYAPGGDRTVITVRFAGSFRALEQEEGRSVGIRPIFRIGGQYGFEIEYSGGTAYLSGGPEGATVSFEWLSDDTIRFVVDGYAPSPGDQIRVDAFSRLETEDGKAVKEDVATVDITE